MKIRNPIAWCAIDTLCCLLLVIYVMVSPLRKSDKPPSIPTFGSYAITMSWRGSDDIDLHVVDPKGDDAYFGSPATNGMSLDHDFIPSYDLATRSSQWSERTIIRATVRGEYIVNAHFYDHPSASTPKPVRVTVVLYRLRGDDKKVFTETFYLNRQGEEHTAFRFTLNRDGDIIEHNHLQKSVIGGEEMYQ